MRSTSALTLALLLMLAPELHADVAQGRWRQVENDDGVRVWRLDVPGRDLPGFRGETLIAAPPEDIVKEVEKVEQHKDWMHRCIASGVIRRLSPEHLVIYNRTDSPWPAWDRDVLLETYVTRDARGATVAFKNTNPALIPVSERVIRMPKLEGFYRMSQHGAAETKVVYQIEVDIGGSIPGWIAESLARDMPFETLRRLRARVLAQRKQARK